MRMPTNTIFEKLGIRLSSDLRKGKTTNKRNNARTKTKEQLYRQEGGRFNKEKEKEERRR